MDTYYGHVRSPADAIKLFEACRLGLLPRVQRRLSEKERQSIKSGSVFVWDEREAGMRRWTDGKSWSASRVSGSFLTYREMEGKRGGGQFVPPPIRRPNGKTPDSGRGSDEDPDLDGDGPDGYRYKPDGLMKQSFSITTSTGQHLHLISYYSRPHPGVPDLPTPTTDPQLRHINPVKGMYPESTVHEAAGPPVTRTPMQQSPYMQHQPVPSPHRNHPQAPYGYQAGYSWPPSPAQTPPYPHYQGPIPHMSNAPMPAMMPHPPPPALAEGALPPPPTSSRGMSTATAANLMPSYGATPSPRVAHARLAAEQQAQIAQRALQAPQMLDPRLTAPISLPPVQIPRTVTPPQTTPVPARPPQPPQPQPRVQTPSPRARPETPKIHGAAPPQSIPSISSLVHATDSVSVMSDHKSNRHGSGAATGSRCGSRHGSHSPQAGGPNDIPHDKLNIGGVGEDQRAIRVLDKKFMI